MSELLKYSVTERNSVVVVSLEGQLERSSAVALSNILGDVSARRPKLVVLNCYHLESVEAVAQNATNEFLIALRRLSPIRFCFLKPSIQETLQPLGIFSADEVRPDLLSAVS